MKSEINMRSEIRNPKSERNPKPEIRRIPQSANLETNEPVQRNGTSNQLGFIAAIFAISAVNSAVSDFGFCS